MFAYVGMSPLLWMSCMGIGCKYVKVASLRNGIEWKCPIKSIENPSIFTCWWVGVCHHRSIRELMSILMTRGLFTEVTWSIDRCTRIVLTWWIRNWLTGMSSSHEEHDVMSRGANRTTILYTWRQSRYIRNESHTYWTNVMIKRRIEQTF